MLFWSGYYGMLSQQARWSGRRSISSSRASLTLGTVTAAELLSEARQRFLLLLLEPALARPHNQPIHDHVECSFGPPIHHTIPVGGQYSLPLPSYARPVGLVGSKGLSWSGKRSPLCAHTIPSFALHNGPNRVESIHDKPMPDIIRRLSSTELEWLPTTFNFNVNFVNSDVIAIPCTLRNRRHHASQWPHTVPHPHVHDVPTTRRGYE